MKFITQISRVLVGVLFIFSGFVKLVDPLGFSYKLDEYFAPDVLNIPFLQPYALGLSVFLVILEVMLGVALLLGFWKKITAWLLLLMIIFFTFLTFYSAYFNKVTDCGCFGDAIPLTPWQSFGKDIVLLVLVVIVFANVRFIKPLFGKSGLSAIMGFILIGCMGLGIYVLNHLPVIDFRPYAEGKNVIEGMKPAEEVGKKPPVYGTVYYLKNQNTGDEKKISSQEYVDQKWYEKKEWKLESDKTETVMLEDGYVPPIHDFVVLRDDEDITKEVLHMPAVFLVIAYDIHTTNPAAYPRINEFANAAEKAGIPLMGLSASLAGDVEKARHELQTPFPFALMDETTLKTIIRANPGVVLLKNGTVAGKWNGKDLPPFEEIRKEYL